MPTEHLHALAEAGVAVRPGPEALVHAQDKAVMRERLTALGVPCPRHAVVTTPRRGRGVRAALRAQDDPRRVRRPRGVDGPRPDEAEEAFATADGTGVQVLAEELVDFRRELAALVARSPSGQAAAYPVVASTQLDGICHEVVAPAPDLAPELATHAQQIALTIAKELDVVGVLAVELFETRDGRVLVNELAMRPAQHRPLEPGRRGHQPVREPPARGPRPAARLARRPARRGR